MKELFCFALGYDPTSEPAKGPFYRLLTHRPSKTYRICLTAHNRQSPTRLHTHVTAHFSVIVNPLIAAAPYRSDS